MNEIRATLSDYRQSPRKVRLVASLIKGKSVAEAMTQLRYTTKRASDPLLKLVKSAVANATHNHKLSTEELVIKDMTVNKGHVLKRFMPRAFGRAAMIRKKMSHVELVLASKATPSDK